MQALRQLLPATRGATKPLELDLPPRNRTKLACEACRQKRTKCNGKQPVCGSCDKRATVCRYVASENREFRKKYENLKKHGSACESLVALIKSGTEEHAVGVIRKLRAGANIQSILDRSSDNITTNPGTIHGACLCPDQGYVVDGAGGNQIIKHFNDLGASRMYATEMGKTAVLQDIMNHLNSLSEDACQRLLGELRCPPANTISMIQLEMGSGLREQWPEPKYAFSSNLFPHSSESTAQSSTAFSAPGRLQNSFFTPELPEEFLDNPGQDPWQDDLVTAWDLPAASTRISCRSLSPDLLFSSPASQVGARLDLHSLQPISGS